MDTTGVLENLVAVSFRRAFIFPIGKLMMTIPIVVHYCFRMRGGKPWKPYGGGTLYYVNDSEQVSKIIDRLDGIWLDFPHSWGLDPHKSIFFYWKPGVGKIYLDPTKTWKEQGVEENCWVYRYIPARYHPAAAA